VTQEASKGRLAGFIALGALLVLVGIAFYAERGSSSTGSTPSPARPEPAGSETSPTSSNQRPPAADGSTPSRPAPLPSEPAPSGAGKGSTITAVLDDVALSPQARLLAERFQCICGCKDILATCTCEKTPGSRDMKKYLQELVTQGKTPAEIEAAMIARYGQDVIP
jgi:cytochrome c-type biogenesis protein CcmH/NrfF